MSSFYKLRLRVPSIHAEFFAACRAAEEARVEEQHAATIMQKYARGFLTRRRIDNLRFRVICIQRVWRGYLGRQRALVAREARDKRLREVYFAAMATTIQRYWRGFWSRKYVFDLHARKLYLGRVAQVNAQMRAVLAEEGERAAHAQKALAHEAARAAFDDKVGKLHHLLSTHSQPGIFASPYALAAGTVPIIAGAPVEDHLKAAFKSVHKTGPQVARGASGSTGHIGTFLPPIKSPNGTSAAMGQSQSGQGGALASRLGASTGGRSGGGGGTGYPPEVYMTGLEKVVPRNITLRQVVPYDAVHQAELLETKVVKAEMMMRHPVPFANSLHKHEQPTVSIQTNQNLEPFVDPWDPTIGARTETFSPRQQALSPTRFSKFLATPAYFDQSLLTQSDTLPPKTFRSQQALGQQPKVLAAAGFSSTDRRRRATKPAR